MKVLLTMLLSILIVIISTGQDELKWQNEIDRLSNLQHERNIDALSDVVLTGSSSARMWKSIPEQFREVNIINNGFGGSQMHELLYFVNELVINYNPDKVLIYEGDNDISAGKSVEEILKSAELIVLKIQQTLPETEIFFISPKPSLARWSMASKYLALNAELEAFCQKTDQVTYIDVWKPMLDEDGKPYEDIFIEDGLHMNEKGYKIWREAVSPYLK